RLCSVIAGLGYYFFPSSFSADAIASTSTYLLLVKGLVQAIIDSESTYFYSFEASRGILSIVNRDEYSGAKLNFFSNDNFPSLILDE
ncbi:hypothetical protein AVEN_141275-1, partial [Araneus ventricosus]